MLPNGPLHHHATCYACVVGGHGEVNRGFLVALHSRSANTRKCFDAGDALALPGVFIALRLCPSASGEGALPGEVVPAATPSISLIIGMRANTACPPPEAHQTCTARALIDSELHRHLRLVAELRPEATSTMQPGAWLSPRPEG